MTIATESFTISVRDIARVPATLLDRLHSLRTEFDAVSSKLSSFAPSAALLAEVRRAEALAAEINTVLGRIAKLARVGLAVFLR